MPIEATPRKDDEDQRELLRRTVDQLSGPARKLIETLSYPHWFEEPMLRRLAAKLEINESFVDVITRSDGWGLIERWNDGAFAVLAPVRELLLKSAAAELPDQYRARSLLFADAFEELAFNGGDVFDHAEAVYHRLVAEPERGDQLMLADGITWKSEPLFAFDALKRLVSGAQEQQKRGMLSERAGRYTSLLTLYLPAAGNTARAEQQILQHLAEFEPDDDLYEAELRLRLGLALLSLGSIAEAIGHFREAEKLFGEAGNSRGRADAMRSLGRAALREDRLDDAQGLFKSAREIFASLGLSVSCAHCNKALAETAFYRGSCNNAEEGFELALAGFVATRSHLGEANTRVVYSQLLSARAELVEAHKQLDIAGSTYLTIGHRLGSANCLKNRAVALFEGERYDEALGILHDAVGMYTEWGSISGRANCFLWMGACHTRLGRADSSVSLLDEADRHFGQIGERYGRASAMRERGIALLALGQPLDAIRPLELSRDEFLSVGNPVEALAASVALGHAAARANFPSPLTRKAIHELASEAVNTFAAIGFRRYQREADRLAIRSSEPSSITQPSELSSFIRSVLSVLDRVEYRYCESGEDLEDIYRLRYESYLRAGMLESGAQRKVTDKFDDLPNSYRFGVYYEGRLVSTLRLHAVGPMHPLSPSTEVFGDVLMPRIAAGETFIDISRLAMDHECSSALKNLPFVTLRLAVVAAQYFLSGNVIGMAEPAHCAFYRRVFLAEILATDRLDIDTKKTVQLLSANVNQNLYYYLYNRFPFFKSTPLERNVLFSRGKTWETGRRSISATAKYMLGRAL
jgi:tetratricopeptide (TPR) repeat protein